MPLAGNSARPSYRLSLANLVSAARASVTAGCSSGSAWAQVSSILAYASIAVLVVEGNPAAENTPDRALGPAKTRREAQAATLMRPALTELRCPGVDSDSTARYLLDILT